MAYNPLREAVSTASFVSSYNYFEYNNKKTSYWTVVFTCFGSLPGYQTPTLLDIINVLDS